MKGLINKLFKGDRSVWIIFMFLCLVSLVEVYSASSTLAYKNTHYWAPIVKHATFLLSGFGLVLLIQHTPSKYFSLGVLLFVFSIGLLIITLFAGERENEASRWLSIFGVQFQPSEFAKLGCIIFVAFMLSKQALFTPKVTFWIIVGGVVIACGLIISENLSTAGLLFFVCFLMMWIGQVTWKRLTFLLAACLLFGSVFIVSLYSVDEDVWRKNLPRALTWKARLDDFGIGQWFTRVEDFVEPKNENKFVLNNDNFQVNHAKIAIARGGLFGKLPGRSVQRDFLPQAYSDFIYAIIIEEMGLIIGGIGVLMLYVFLMFRVGIIARRCEKQFPRYLVLGCGLLIVVQAFLNMAVAVNLFPVTGQPLPLISRGGTSTIITCCYFGIILSISRFGAGMGDEEDEDKALEVELTDATVMDDEEGEVKSPEDAVALEGDLAELVEAAERG